MTHIMHKEKFLLTETNQELSHNITTNQQFFQYILQHLLSYQNKIIAKEQIVSSKQQNLKKFSRVQSTAKFSRVQPVVHKTENRRKQP